MRRCAALRLHTALVVAPRGEANRRSSAGSGGTGTFSEPGLFLMRPDGTLYRRNVSTMPFAHMHCDEILAAIDFALKNNYPARGEA